MYSSLHRHREARLPRKSCKLYLESGAARVHCEFASQSYSPNMTETDRVLGAPTTGRPIAPFVQNPPPSRRGSALHERTGTRPTLSGCVFLELREAVGS